MVAYQERTIVCTAIRQVRMNPIMTVDPARSLTPEKIRNKFIWNRHFIVLNEDDEGEGDRGDRRARDVYYR